MMSNNKILTVSYGTFSCTLEGFDDSFGTMKAIAEYFRDLASDDRYFGAEPPQPDAEMLTRIAQKEVSRRVEAREQDGKIVLSAIEDGTNSTSNTGAPVAEALAVAAAVVAPEIVEEVAAEPVEISLADENTVVAETKVAEVEDVTEVETTRVEVVAADLMTQDDVVEDVVDVKGTPVEIKAEFVEDENDIVPGQPDADVEAFFADSPAADDTVEEEMITVDDTVAEVANAPAPNSIAAKLQRIRAVVAQQEEAETEDDYLEDEHAEENNADSVETVKADADDLIADARADIEDALDVDEAVDAQSNATDEEDDVSAILSRLESLTEDTQTAAEDQSATVKETSIGDLDDHSDADARSVEDTVSNLFDEDEATLDADTEEQAAAAVSLRKAAIVTPSEELEVVAQDNQDDNKPARRARVIKVKRADLEAAIQKGDLEEYDEANEAVSEAQADTTEPRKLDELAPAKSKTTALSPEDEDELARELAELEADISQSDDKPMSRRAARRAAAAARDALPSIDEDNETDVNRLLAETDHQMDEPESATRRDAFAHLRAAVAAKKADVAMGENPDAEESDDVYRHDLAEVVRPRRPVSNASRSERPSDVRPAPLKLVAEQRIDVAKPASTGPVRPRRVSAADVGEETVAAPDGESFTDFASEMGASTLPQLLEAAAAYMSFVEGRAQFSRPQLMTKVRQAGGEESFSREEGLRSFGQLLRAGKIEKIKGGRFTVSEEIGYRPDERAAG